MGREKPVIGYFVFNLTSYSGAALQALFLAKHLRDHEVIFFNVERERRWLDIDRSGANDGIVVHLPRNPLRAMAAILSFVRRHQIEIFHLHGLVGIGLLTGLLLRRRLVLKSTLLGWDDFDSIRARRWGGLLLSLLRRVDRNIVLSRALEEINCRHLSAEQVKRLPNGVEIGATPLAKRDPLFCTVGVVCPRKQTHLAIEGFLRSYAHLEGAMLYVVGPTNSEARLDESSESYLAHCNSLVPGPLRERVVFTGRIPKNELDRIYHACLGFLSFSTFEGMPNALLEAMAANCVPVVGDLGGVAHEVVSTPECGFILAPDATPPTLDALRELSATKAPYQRVRARFSLEHIASEYARIYRELLNR